MGYEVIRRGYFIPFEGTPPSILLPNNQSARRYCDFVSHAVSDLLELGLISDVFTVVNPLTASSNSERKSRLVLDLRLVNKYYTAFPR